MEYDASDVASIAQLAREGTAAEIVNAKNGRQLMLHNPGLAVVDVTSQHGLLSSRPEYVKQTVNIQKTMSLVDYINRYKLTETTIFANINTDRIDAVIDYHGPGVDPSEADYLAHRTNMQLQKSEEWKLWVSIDKKLMGQLDFARFVEENASDIEAPSAGELLDTVRDLQANRKVNFTKAVRTASDNENFEFTVDNEAKTRGGLEIPTKFLLRLPVYFGEPPVLLSAFLRWKIDPEQGGLQLGISINRAEFVRQEEFQRIAREVSEATERPVIYGVLA
jgi:uncharacterized protein YfdQ (DUF2303 family)